MRFYAPDIVRLCNLKFTTTLIHSEIRCVSDIAMSITSAAIICGVISATLTLTYCATGALFTKNPKTLLSLF